MTKQNVGMVEIQQVINPQLREEFMKQFRRLAMNNNTVPKDLTFAVNKELDRQNDKLASLQAEIDQLSTDTERKYAIMKVTDNGMRMRLISLYNHLFTQQQEEQPSAVWDEKAGLFSTPEQQVKEKRQRIMAIKDPKERQAMIAVNLDLFN